MLRIQSILIGNTRYENTKNQNTVPSSCVGENPIHNKEVNKGIKIFITNQPSIPIDPSRRLPIFTYTGRTRRMSRFEITSLRVLSSFLPFFLRSALAGNHMICVGYVSVHVKDLSIITHDLQYLPKKTRG